MSFQVYEIESGEVLARSDNARAAVDAWNLLCNGEGCEPLAILALDDIASEIDAGTAFERCLYGVCRGD